MKEDQQRFLALFGQLPARLTAEQTAWVVNCQPHDIPALLTARLLRMQRDALNHQAAAGAGKPGRPVCLAHLAELGKERSDFRE